jgi:hypothetical protein
VSQFNRRLLASSDCRDFCGESPSKSAFATTARGSSVAIASRRA